MSSEDARRMLDRLIREHGTDYAAISRLLGRNPSYVQQFIKRGVPRRLHEDDRRRLAAHFRVPEAALGGPGFGDMPSPTDAANHPDTADSFVFVPTYNISVSAGSGRIAEQEQPFGALAFRRSWIRSIGPSAMDNLVVLQVEGDSMYPTLAHGDHVLVDTGQAQHLRDGIYVIRTHDSLQVKRISVNPVNRRISVKSDNAAYDSWPDCDPGELAVIGRVAWMGRRL